MPLTQVATARLAMLVALLGSTSIAVAAIADAESTIKVGSAASHMMRSEKSKHDSSHMQLEVESDGQAALLEGAATANQTMGHRGSAVACPFTASTQDSSMQCMDESFCDPHSHSKKWACCKEAQGRKICPVMKPLMCNLKDCDGDHCCDTDCTKHGGLRVCEVCIETLAGYRNNAYRGCQTRTRSGKKCQRWDVQKPHVHNKIPKNYPGDDLRENFCRNPDGGLSIWCYTEEKRQRYEFCDPVLPPTSLDGLPSCSVALPLIGSRVHPRLQNAKIKASSYLDNAETAGKEEMWRSRMENIGSTWTAELSDSDPWLQWDFETPKMIHKIQTKGRADTGAEWVTKYKISFSADGDAWTMLDQDFEGNTDKDSIFENTIDPPVIASMIRLFPTGFHEKISMRAEMYGCTAPKNVAASYYEAECCSGDSCDESVKTPKHVTWQQCFDKCVKKNKRKPGKCKGFQFGKDNEDGEFDECQSPGTCACWLIHGQCTRRQHNAQYDAFLFEAPTTPLRLIGFDGEVDIKGRVELERNSQWGSVCSDLFTNKAAEVVCRQLGLKGGKIMNPDDYAKSKPDAPIWMDNLDCKGDERALWLCPFAGWGKHNCEHKLDVGVECDKPKKGFKPKKGSLFGRLFGKRKLR